MGIMGPKKKDNSPPMTMHDAGGTSETGSGESRREEEGGCQQGGIQPRRRIELSRPKTLEKKRLYLRHPGEYLLRFGVWMAYFRGPNTEPQVWLPWMSRGIWGPC